MNVLLTNELHMQTVRQDHNRTIEALTRRHHLMQEASATRRAEQHRVSQNRSARSAIGSLWFPWRPAFPSAKCK